MNAKTAEPIRNSKSRHFLEMLIVLAMLLSLTQVSAFSVFAANIPQGTSDPVLFVPTDPASDAVVGNYALGRFVTVSSVGTDSTGGGIHRVGESVSISAGTPPEDQQFVTWSVDYGSVTLANLNSASTSFTMPDSDVSVTAHFRWISSKAMWNVYVSSIGTGSEGSGKYNPGATVGIYAGIPPEGLRFAYWSSAQNNTASIVFTNAGSERTTFTLPNNTSGLYGNEPSGDITVVANFEPIDTQDTAYDYNATVSSAGIGATGSDRYKPGAVVNIYAGKHPSGLGFRYWSIDSGRISLANPSNESTSFTMPGSDVTVTAHFGTGSYGGRWRVNVYPIRPGGSGDGDYLGGEIVYIHAGTPPAGYEFAGWSTSPAIKLADPNSPDTSFVMPDYDVNVTPLFKPISDGRGWVVTVSSAGIGATGSDVYGRGAVVNIGAGTPSANQRFSHWTTNFNQITFANPNSAATSFTLPNSESNGREVIVTANFVPMASGGSGFKVTVISAGTGAAGSDAYQPGVTVNISAGTPPMGQRFVNWSTNPTVPLADANSAGTSFTMPGRDVFATANFEPIPGYSPGEGGPEDPNDPGDPGKSGGGPGDGSGGDGDGGGNGSGSDDPNQREGGAPVSSNNGGFIGNRNIPSNSGSRKTSSTSGSANGSTFGRAPQTGVPDITGAVASMTVSFGASAGLCAYILRRRYRG